MTGNFYGPASCGWGWGCGLRRFRCECVSVSVRVCVCRETFASNCSILSSVCSELGMCANSLSSASRVFFSLLPSAFLPAKYLDYRCRHKLCAALQTTSSPVPCRCRVSCPCAWPSAKCQVFTPTTVCVCVNVCAPPLFEATLWCM